MFEIDPRDEKRGGPRPQIDLAALLAEQARTLARKTRVRPPLTRLLAVPRAITLAGQVIVVGELTLGDVAELQAFLERMTPDPLNEPDLATAWEAAKAWPPRYGMPEGNRLLGTPAGRAEVLRVTLRQEALDAMQLRDLVEQATPAEWTGFERIAWGVTPRAELVARLAPSNDPPSEVDWEKRLAFLIESTGWDFDQIGRLTLSQARYLCGGWKTTESTREFQARAVRAGRAFR